jgi:hypothetical protein
MSPVTWRTKRPKPWRFLSFSKCAQQNLPLEANSDSAGQEIVVLLQNRTFCTMYWRVRIPVQRESRHLTFHWPPLSYSINSDKYSFMFRTCLWRTKDNAAPLAEQNVPGWMRPRWRHNWTRQLNHESCWSRGSWSRAMRRQLWLNSRLCARQCHQQLCLVLLDAKG